MDTQQQQFEQQQKRRRRSLGFDDEQIMENGHMRIGGELKRRTTESTNETDSIVGPGVSGMALQ